VTKDGGDSEGSLATTIANSRVKKRFVCWHGGWFGGGMNASRRRGMEGDNFVLMDLTMKPGYQTILTILTWTRRYS